eukprot:scaffold473451_cov31-Prasinocladus_malaysianus.AAC.1
MGVHVADVLRCEHSVVECQLDAAADPGPRRQGVRHVVRVAGHGPSHVLGVYLGPPRLGMLQALQYKHT